MRERRERESFIADSSSQMNISKPADKLRQKILKAHLEDETETSLHDAGY